MLEQIKMIGFLIGAFIGLLYIGGCTPLEEARRSEAQTSVQESGPQPEVIWRTVEVNRAEALSWSKVGTSPDRGRHLKEALAFWSMDVQNLIRKKISDKDYEVVQVPTGTCFDFVTFARGVLYPVCATWGSSLIYEALRYEVISAGIRYSFLRFKACGNWAGYREIASETPRTVKVTRYLPVVECFE